ncbi:MAG: hypothetical protein K0U37_07140 [Gammaproteobacteria bacterium]|nr:hypothetical protein [Gammaproteobacteria bacterium]
MALPSRDTLVACADIATTGKAAEYLAVSIEAIFAKERVLDQFSGLIDKFYEHADEVIAGEEAVENIWGGDEPVTIYEVDAERRVDVVESQVDPLPEIPDQVDMKLVLGGQEVESGYAINNEPPDEETRERMNSLVGGWLAKEGCLIRTEEFEQDGEIIQVQRILEATKKGEPKLDENGDTIPVDVEDLKARMTAEDIDKHPGLKKYVDSHARGLVIHDLEVEISDGLDKQATPEPDEEVSGPE